MEVLQRAKDRLLFVKLEAIEIEQFIEMYERFAAVAAAEPQRLAAAQTEPDQAPVEHAPATPASVEGEAAGEGAHNPTSPALHPQSAVDADVEEQDLIEVLHQAHEKAAASPPAGEASAASPAPSTRQRVKALHDAHPEYTRQQAWEALGITEGSLAGHGSALGIKWAPKKPEGVRAPAPAPKPVRQLDRPPASSLLPSSALTGRTSPGAVVTKPPVRPRGTRFYLRDDEGRYLHFSCAGMTADKGHAWIGDERQLAGCRKAFSIARDLREVVVPNEKAAA